MSFTNTEFELIKTLTELDGVSGLEKDIRDYLKNEYQKLGCSLMFDNLGGIFACKKSHNPNAFNVMIDAHMDEVGFLTSHIKDNETISLLAVGGITNEDVNNAKARIKTKNGYLFGTIKADKDTLEIKLDEAKDNLNELVNYGDMVTFVTNTTQIAENRYLAKAYDDRYGLALGIEILRHFTNKELPFNLYVGGTVQEEVGLRGATLNLDKIKPDLAIVLDCSRAANDDKGFGILGKGVLIRYFDRAMVAFKELLELQIKACKASNANYQYFATMGGTNAGAIHRYGEGILTLTHCVCAKNIHTQSCEFDSDDYQAAKKSLIKLLEDLNENTLNELRSYRR